ncbi:MAG: RusA family crossover junction endodeoxyribonuclease [Magnetococcales bacterium]|nr:RusA family crossover junction endodeoxyribonuclease [Magnetococcales bacterium]
MLEFPFEYVLLGTPFSSQNKNSAYTKWRSNATKSVEDEVFNRTNGRMYIPTNNLVYVKIAWFSSQPSAGDHPDLDNIIKPLLDAMSGFVIKDDRQVRYINVSKVDLNRPGLRIPSQMKELEDTQEYAKGEVVFIAVYPFDEVKPNELNWWL